MEANSHFQNLNIYFYTPSQGAPPSRSSLWSASKRDTLFQWPSIFGSPWFTSLLPDSRSPLAVKESQSRAFLNLLTPNDDYSGRTAPLTSKHFVLYMYSTNTGTEYFKRGICCPFFPLQNAVCFINLTYLVSVLFTFYIQGVLKLKE